MWPGRSTILALALALGSAAAAQEATPEAGHELRLPLEQGISFALPEGWVKTGASTGKRRRVHLACRTELCERTLETCTFVLRDDPVEGTSDAERFASLYASPFARYARLRAVLKNTSEDAMLRQTLHVAAIGGRDWHVVETDARHNMKSGLFAETVIDGRYVGLICKTCETGEIRHRDARALMASLKGSERRAGLRR